MRVIAGKYKGRALFSPKDESVRPTTDRIKENVFNLLQRKIPGCAFLDLFGGSGAMTIEALSRGAKESVTVDISRDSIALIKKNFSKIGIGKEARLLECGYDAAARLLSGKKFDVVFLDPPYKADFYETLLDSIKENALLAEEGVVVFEHASERPLRLPFGWIAADERRYGSVTVSILTYIDS